MALVGSENMIFHNLLYAEDGLSGCLTIILDYCHPSHFTSNPHIVLLILFSTAQVFQCSHFFIVFIFCGSVSLEVFPLGRRERGGVLLSRPNTSIFFAAHYEKEFKKST